MGSFSLFFWLLFIILLELFWVRNSIQIISLGICWSLIISGFLLNLEYDLISVLYLSSAITAYLALSLCLLHLGQNNSTIEKNNKISNLSIGLFLLVLIIYLSIKTNLFINKNINILSASLVNYIDSTQSIITTVSSLLVIHEFFFCIFILETWLLNIYITVGLLLAIFLLSGNRKITKKDSEFINQRIRNIAKLRRQTRRKDGSLIF